jgi:alginate O-acetyltransferase complex protein AlgI
MAFNSPFFLFVFLPFALVVILLTPKRFGTAALLVVSLAFYSWGEPKFIFVAIASALFDWLMGNLVARAPGAWVRKAALAAGIIANLALLFSYKYTAFFLQSVQDVFGGGGVPIARVALPLGISFIVFEKITYLVDISRGVSKPARTMLHYLAYVFLFPKLIAGPIVKYHDIEHQLFARNPKASDIETGATRFLIGMAKKTLIADTVAIYADKVFAAPPQSLSCAQAWLGALCFAVQIFFDFSGYSDMAIGLCRIFGLRLIENFNQPYLAAGFSDFWKRWHISLSTWIRDYLYIPLGGNRVSPLRLYLNLWICFLASGLWHGAAWTFVVWGAYHGAWVSLDHLFLGRIWPRLPRAAGVAITFFLIVIGWAFFRQTSIGAAGQMIAAMFDPARTSGAAIPFTPDVATFLTIGLVLSFIPREAAAGIPLDVRHRIAPPARAALLLVSLWSFGHLLSADFSPFLYFRF